MSIQRGIDTLSIVIAAAAVLSSCVNQETEDQEAESQIENQQVEKRNELNSFRNNLIAVKQGCEGRIVVGARLRRLVVGKSHAYKLPGVASKGDINGGLKRFNYHIDGRLHLSNSSSNTFYTFKIRESEFCHKTQPPECFRLIEGADGVVYSEYVTYDYAGKSLPKKIKLQCVALEIKDLENDK